MSVFMESQNWQTKRGEIHFWAKRQWLD